MGIDKENHSLQRACDYLSMLWFKSNHVKIIMTQKTMAGCAKEPHVVFMWLTVNCSLFFVLKCVDWIRGHRLAKCADVATNIELLQEIKNHADNVSRNEKSAPLMVLALKKNYPSNGSLFGMITNGSYIILSLTFQCLWRGEFLRSEVRPQLPQSC